MNDKLHALSERLDGDLYYDELMRILYATDASVYKELPLAVANPRHEADIREIARFAAAEGVPLIPRAAGTSLAGQCVGTGMVVDVSRYMNNIVELNTEESWVRLQPGVIRNELNAYLQPEGLFFGPNTSTANRAMIGGMVGNNSCGTTSIVYGSTRDHVMELRVVLSDGTVTTFGPVDAATFRAKMQGEGLEARIYRQVYERLRDPGQREAIRREYPKPNIHRRNTGYALDMLLEMEPLVETGETFNFCKLLCGSEGTLALVTEIKLHVDPLPEPEDVVLCAHFHNIDESLRAVLLAMEEQPTACELMDKIILDCTKQNLQQSKNRFFVEGDPEAILMVEFRALTGAEAREKAEKLAATLREAGLGYAYPVVPAPESKKAWALRAAGLGVLANMPGDPKAVACIEDTAVAIDDLPDYISDFAELMEGFGQKAVYYAHAGAGELHLRPILDLKKAEGQEQFYRISEAVARLVKKYQGALSGEHGDGRVRAEFIPMMVGEENYQLLREVKQTWDPQGIFNPGKIVDAPPMKSHFRYEAEQETPEYNTVFDFSDHQGILRLAEKCNGTGDCRKLPFSGGTMCPSYMATRNEKDSTRARANALREYLSMNGKPNPFDRPELYDVMDLCLSCKGCTSECPSNVDVATLKAEFLYQYQKSNGVPFRSKVFANIGKLNRLAMMTPALSNLTLNGKLTSGLLKRILGVAPQRSLPALHPVSLEKWFARNRNKLQPREPRRGKVWFFCDEFTNFNDTAIGIRGIQLLTRLGYEVQMIKHPESGRAHISKGLLKEARDMARENVRLFRDRASASEPLVGIEPSAILGFRDEYPRLVAEEDREAARELGKHALLLEEFLAGEAAKGNIAPESFTQAPERVMLHGHCHQKALADFEATAWLLSLPTNYNVEVIQSGCCGMAGSFGYEKEHYDLSMQIGELVLFPAVRAAPDNAVIAAAGTSCRHQIFDGTGRQALHPVEILYQALAPNASADSR